MQDQHVPAISRFYWPAFAATTLFGNNAGDWLIAFLTPGGHADYFLPILAAVFLAVLYLEARDPAPQLRWYWLAIVIAPTASNHLAELSFFYLDFGFRRAAVFALFLVILALTHLAFQSDAQRLIALRLQERPTPTVPLTDATYWIGLIVASTAGALASDFLSLGLGIDERVACIILLLPLAGAVVARRSTGLNRTATYWAMVVALNALSTIAGGLLANDARLGIGLGWSVAALGALLAILLPLASSPSNALRHAR